MNLTTKTRMFLACVLILAAISITLGDGVRKRIRFPRGRTSTVINNAVLREDVRKWSGTLTETGDYIIEVAPTRGNATYRMKVEIH